MAEEKAKMEFMFPIPIYNIKRDSDLDLSEKKDIEDIIEEGIHLGGGHSFSNNSYIFNTKLKKLKEFCEEHLKQYVKETINPKEECEFYITQSWLNITKPGEWHHEHTHPNSIVSGIFYIQTDVGQTLTFHDPNAKIKQIINIDPQKVTPYVSDQWSFNVTNNQFLLFPSWMNHSVIANEKQTKKNVISLSFNTFVKGTIGNEMQISTLVL